MGFWMSYNFGFSPIDALLEDSSCTLEQLMDEPDLLRECRSYNTRLIELFAAAAPPSL